MSKHTNPGTARAAKVDTQENTAFAHSIQVRWADCDPAQIAYTGRIPCFALEAIDAWWKATTHYDWYELNIDRKIGTPFVHMSMDLRAPITPRHSLDCTVSLIRLGTSSIRHKVEGRQAGKLCFEGEFVAVFVQPDRMETCKPPLDMLEILRPLVC